MLYTVIYINKMVDKLLVIYYDKVHELRVFIFCHRCVVKRVSVNGVSSNTSTDDVELLIHERM